MNSNVNRRPPAQVAIVVCGLSDSWLGGVNYYRNLVTVFDHAGEQGLRLHVLTDQPQFFADMALSERVRVRHVPMLVHKSSAWALRKALLVAFKRDVSLIKLLKQLNVEAAVFCHVAGAAAAGVVCLPWIPDFQSRRHPELFPPALARAEHLRAQAWLRDSSGLLVSSRAAQHDAVALYGADPSRVHVLHFAPRLDAAPLLSASLRDAVLARHHIDRAYFFLPNQYWKHKNHLLVAQALVRLREQGAPMPLVVSTGKTEDTRHPGYFAEFERFIQAEGLQPHYRILGVIDRQDMLVLLAHARAVINPSRFEGWNTGVEEAKALGKPLLVSDIDVHREQVAGWPELQVFGVDDVAALAAALGRWQMQALAPDGHPPKPHPALYEGFSAAYMALLHRVLQRQPEGVAA
jgi:glycosyltransferase involved in cell wall biosynthesis